MRQELTPVDPAGGHCYQVPIKPCKSKGRKITGVRLSNTRTIYPQVGHNLGKLRVIPHSHSMLEGLDDESYGA